MALTKADIIESIFNTADVKKIEASRIIKTLLEIIKSKLESGEDVLISGFGKFRVQDKNERKGRNPYTSTEMILGARRVVTFKCSGKLKDRMNGKK